MKTSILALTLLLAGGGSALAATQTYTGTVLRVIDGDTVVFRADKEAQPQTLRLEGVDAPEICQMGGQEAAKALSRLVLKKRVQARVRSVDMYHRGVARLTVGSDDVGGRLVRSGQAWAYRWQGDAGVYGYDENLARSARRGLFEQRNPESPAQFRKRNGSCPPASYSSSKFSGGSAARPTSSARVGKASQVRKAQSSRPTRQGTARRNTASKSSGYHAGLGPGEEVLVPRQRLRR